MNNDNTVAVDAEVASSRIHQKEPVALLLPDIGDPQLLRIEEFNDPSLQRHAYNSVICLMRC